MFSVKKIMLVAALTNLACRAQAWAMDDFNNPYIAASARHPVSLEHELKASQEAPPSVATQLQIEQAENKKLKALRTALRAKNKELKAQLAVLQLAQSALAPALTPTISRTYKSPELGLKKPNRKTRKKATKAKTSRLKKKKKVIGLTHTKTTASHCEACLEVQGSREFVLVNLLR